MKLNLTKPLIVFDIESTGPNPAKDRIIEISMQKFMPDGSEVSKTWLMNPTVSIPQESSEIHGYYDADVEGKPTFEDLADELIAFIDNADFAGYNSGRFDVPLLVEEFLRLDKDLALENRMHIDVMRIFMKKEQRTLQAALKFYCNEELENAHKADVDVAATSKVLFAQLERYNDLEGEVKFLHEFCKDGEFIDFARRMYWKDDEAYFNFGKHKGRRVFDVFYAEPSYYNWIVKADFPLDTKNKLKKLKLEYDNTKM